MKALKVIGIIVAILIAALLIIPLFVPSPARVSAEIDIALEPGQIFPRVASFSDREAWDPWLTMDSTAEADIESMPDYVGSTYAWSGDAVGTGRMEVVSTKENAYIESHLWFGETETPALVEWHLEAAGEGTHVTWSFEQATPYPFGRLGMIIGKVFLRRSFELGLSNLKEWLESVPPATSSLGPISIETQAAMPAMVIKESSTLETLGESMESMFGRLMPEVQAQGLMMSGPPFADYLDMDMSTGEMTLVVGVQVAKAGKVSGDVVPVVYNEMQVVTAIHTGSYEELHASYELMQSHIEQEGLELTGEAFEFYLTDPMSETDPSKWQTRISFPLVK